MNISVSLTPELIGLTKAKVDSGHYTSISEVVPEALRLLERADRQEVERVKGLRRAFSRVAVSFCESRMIQTVPAEE